MTQDTTHDTTLVTTSEIAGGLEYIHGNHDGADGASDTYTICRVRVPKARLLEEVRAGLHPNYQIPGDTHTDRDYVRNIPNARGIDNIDSAAPWTCKAQNEPLRTPEGSLDSFLRARPSHPSRMTEFIHGEQPAGRAKHSYTVCRLGVSRQKLVEEIEAGMHPGYFVATRDGHKVPQPRPRKNPGAWPCCMLSQLQGVASDPAGV